MSRILITSALPYINGVKHIGNLAGSMLPADVHARFRRQQGHEVLFICGTDEHGTPAELAAVESHMEVAAYCDQQHKLQRAVCDGFELSFDHFGRSSSPSNYRLTQELAQRLEANGFIEERSSLQLYSERDGRFLPDRYVEGTCPRCGYAAARGDQCDGCGSLLDAIDLIEPRSRISGARDLEVRETRHLFLLQSRLAEAIRAWVDSCREWPDLARSIAYKWLNEGLRDRAITRDLSWGVPVLKDGAVRPGFESKVFYVWFDAPIGYIAATCDWAEAAGDDWQRWWRTDQGADDVTYVQFMGKDNVAFHTVSFPATIIGSGEKFRLVDRLKAFNWLQWEGDKFSTSRRSGLFMDQALKLLPADYWRWYLTAHAPEGADSQFNWEHFAGIINADLVNTFGNLALRILRPALRQNGGRVPEPAGRDALVGVQMAERLDRIAQHHEAMEFRAAARETRALWAFGNEYVARSQPWLVERADGRSPAAVMREALEVLRLVAIASAPIIPFSARRLLKCVGVEDERALYWPVGTGRELLEGLETGAVLCEPGRMFERIDGEALAAAAATGNVDGSQATT